jgi:hypothetical protein
MRCVKYGRMARDIDGQAREQFLVALRAEYVLVKGVTVEATLEMYLLFAVMVWKAREYCTRV